MQLARILNPTTWFGKQNVGKSWLSFSSSSAGWRNNPQWFQMGDGPPSSHEAMAVSTVYACVKLISEEMARLNIDHLKPGDNGGIEKVTQSAPFQVLRNPNRYQTRSDFILYMMMQLLLTGNAYAIATRDRRGAINSLHPLPGKSATPHVVPDTGEIFYHFSSFDVSASEIGDGGTMIPQRDVLHIRHFTPTHPLIGMSPLVAAAMAMSKQMNINLDSAEFFANMSKPAGLLTTPKPLNKEAAKRLKKAWEEAQNGKTPILDNEITYQSFTMSAVEAELILQFNLTVKEIASVYRVPLNMLGEPDSGKLNNVEHMQRMFVVSTLGFHLVHLETAFDKFFDVKVGEAIKFDLESGMMRSDLKSRMDALSVGVKGAITTPNEARAKENLPPVAGGDQVFLQQQNWPIEMLGSNSGDAVEKPSDSNDDDDDPGSDDDDPDNIDEEEQERALAEMIQYVKQKTIEVKAA